MPNVTDLQVAESILPQLAIEKGKLLDSLVAELSEVGLLNADKNGLFDKLNLTAFNNHD